VETDHWRGEDSDHSAESHCGVGCEALPRQGRKVKARKVLSPDPSSFRFQKAIRYRDSSNGFEEDLACQDDQRQKMQEAG